jgi:Fe-S-cluster-containing hydrogenase component 2
MAVYTTNSIELIESNLTKGETCTSCGTCASICPMGVLISLEEHA